MLCGVLNLFPCIAGTGVCISCSDAATSYDFGITYGTRADDGIYGAGAGVSGAGAGVSGAEAGVSGAEADSCIIAATTSTWSNL